MVIFVVDPHIIQFSPNVSILLYLCDCYMYFLKVLYHGSEIMLQLAINTHIHLSYVDIILPSTVLHIKLSHIDIISHITKITTFGCCVSWVAMFWFCADRHFSS